MEQIERKKRADQKKFHFIYRTTCKVTSRYYYGMHSTDDMVGGLSEKQALPLKP